MRLKMKERLLTMALVMLVACTTAEAKKKVSTVELWPDGTEIPAWFSDTSRPRNCRP